MDPIWLIGAAVLGAARWLKNDARRRDVDPQSQVRSDWLEFREWDRKQPPPLPRRKRD